MHVTRRPVPRHVGGRAPRVDGRPARVGRRIATNAPQEPPTALFQQSDEIGQVAAHGRQGGRESQTSPEPDRQLPVARLPDAPMAHHRFPPMVRPTESRHTGTRQRMLNDRSRSADPARRVLLAVTNDEVLPAYEALFHSRRIAVEHAQTGPEALAKALRQPPEVLVAEAPLPLFDACILCELLRREPATRSLPIVVITTPEAGDLPDRAIRAGASIVLPQDQVQQHLWSAICRLRRASPAPDPSCAAALLPQAHRRRNRALVDVTISPSLRPPLLRCPRCDGSLRYERSYVGGVRTSPEQWDHFICPSGCGGFEYRQRTRHTRRLDASIGSARAPFPGE